MSDSELSEEELEVLAEDLFLAIHEIETRRGRLRARIGFAIAGFGFWLLPDGVAEEVLEL